MNLVMCDGLFISPCFMDLPASLAQDNLGGIVTNFNNVTIFRCQLSTAWSLAKSLVKFNLAMWSNDITALLGSDDFVLIIPPWSMSHIL